MDLLSVTLIALAGGALPLLVKWNDRHLHTALALSTGIFLGAVFLHFLPALSHVQLGQGVPNTMVGSDHVHGPHSTGTGTDTDTGTGTDTDTDTGTGTGTGTGIDSDATSDATPPGTAQDSPAKQSPGHELGHDHGHDEGHDHGHDEGHDHGHDEGHDHGHDEGHDHGHDEGHDHGHNEGHDHDHGPSATVAHLPSSSLHLTHNHGEPPWIWLCVLIGVLSVYMIESLVLRTHDHDDLHQHKSVGYAALVGLSIHALTAGIGYSAAQNHEEVGAALLIAILAHKGFETFSLTTVFLLAGMNKTSILKVVGAFSLITPLGMLLGTAISRGLGPNGLGILTALAAGTFLYVCLCELLPEVFHHREDSWRRVGLLATGIGLMLFFEWAGH